nr:immunoglobulin heavy chain junction region [Mus musculus]
CARPPGNYFDFW